MLRIPLSTINSLGFDFGGAVDQYINKLNEHREQTGIAAPAARHPLVERSVARVQYGIDDGKPDDFVRAFEIVDDTPTLEARKAVLANDVAMLALAAAHKVIPPLKVASWNFEVADAQAVKPSARTKAHIETIAQHDARQKRIEGINRHLAKLHSEIHDLTDETFHEWSPVPFPT